MARVLGRRARIALGAALVLLVPGLASTGSAPAAGDTIAATVVSTQVGQPMPASFIGESFEYRAIHQYTGRDPRAVDPVLLALVQGLVPGQRPVVRIGGDSADGTWWPIRGKLAPGGVYYALTPGWLRTTHAFAADLGAKLILGVNLEAGRPAIAAAEGRSLLAGIGRRYIQAVEIGNEPDLYGVFPWYRDRRGHLHRGRGRHYGLRDYEKEFKHWRRVLPRLPVAGPVASGPSFMRHLGRFISSERRLKLVTYHRYPLRACIKTAASPAFPTIPNLLADRSSAGLASGVAPFVRVADRHRLPLRLTELNSASCEGAAGVSDTFASALWALDTLFGMASAGVDGVNFHMLPGSHYELFSPSRTSSGGWQAFVHPEYYGLLAFSQAFPPGARRLRVSAPDGSVKVWATQDPGGTVRVTLINKDLTNAHSVRLQIPGPPRPASLTTLRAASASSTSGVTLGGQSFGSQTSTGKLGPQHSTPLAPPRGGGYSIQLPAASAAVVTATQSAGSSALARHR
ncbi:MAG: glycosyl hydrolase family protein [Actinomycetota bacterium]|nr:glycosyl hydrolase family protein [Actinomycetota bacterium]